MGPLWWRESDWLLRESSVIIEANEFQTSQWQKTAMDYFNLLLKLLKLSSKLHVQ